MNFSKTTPYPTENLTTNSLNISKMIKNWGGSSSITLLDPTCEIFQTPQIEGVIGYKEVSGCIIVFGDPICAPHDRDELIRIFHQFFDEQKKAIIYTTASQEFAKWAINNVCGGLIEFGEELFLDPYHLPEHGSNSRLIHKKMRHALSEGTEFKEYSEENPSLEKSIDDAAKAWLDSRKGPQIYLAHVDLFANKIGKRWFYAEKDNKIVGILLLNRLDARDGWGLHLLMQTPDAPNGTSELLVLNVAEKLKKEGCHYLTFGSATGDYLGEIQGLGNLSSWMARKGFQLTKKIFKLDGRRKYWLKFEPQKEPSYVLFSNPNIGIKEIVSLMRALNVTF